MKRKPDDDNEIPMVVWRDAEARIGLMEAMPHRAVIRRSAPKSPVRHIVPVPARALILGPDGKPLGAKP